MHGIIALKDQTRENPATRRRKALVTWARRNRRLFLFVVAPTLIVAAYYYLIAADQYESEAHFVVRTSNSPTPTSTGLSQVISLATGGDNSQSDAMAVLDYLSSHDVVEVLAKRDHLVERFQRPEADYFSRLSADPLTPEALVKYYRKRVKAAFASDTGIAALTVTAFRPDDAFEITQSLLKLGENRVNSLNERSYNDAVSQSLRQQRDAEASLRTAQIQLARFRREHRDIDPKGSGEAQLGLVTGINVNLTAARAQLATMSGLISASSPQYVALAARVRALEAQAGTQAGRLAGEGTTIASSLGDYEDLRLKEEFAAKRYEAAAAAVEKASDQAAKQQLYLVRIVNANRPVKSTSPQRARIVLTVFASLLVAYAIGWLIGAGVKEHAA